MAYPSNSQIADDLLYANNYWSGSSVSFSFPGSGAAWTGYAAGSEPTNSHYAGVTGGQADVLRGELAVWDKLISISLVETGDPGQIRVAFTDVKTGPDDNTWGYAVPPPTNGGAGNAKSGDVWIEYQKAGSAFTPTTYDYMAAMHELGHALGLKHSFEGANTLPSEFENYRYSIMSYTPNQDSVLVSITPTAGGIQSSGVGVYPTTPMVFDVAAIQARYGADAGTAAGDNTYTFDQSKPTFLTLYDAGGTDVIDLSTHTRGSIIDLTPGAYSSIDHYTAAQQAADQTAIYPWAADFISAAYNKPTTFTWTDNVGIALNTTIENVRAGSGADSIRGNDANNNIAGGAGADTIQGGQGQDYLRGDDGNDLIVGGADFDDTNGNRGDDTVYGGEGNDWVVGGQDQDLLYGENGNDVLYGNLGVDTLNAGAGDDWLRGGQGDDVLVGDAGNDYLSGDRGNDTETGGAGADRFSIFAGAGIDRVTDFNSGEGDRVSIEGALPYTVTFSGGDTIISIGGGDQMILAGVANAGQLGNWLFA